DATAVKVSVPRIEFGKSPGKIVGEDFVAQPESLNVVDQFESANLNAPGLIIDPSDGENDLFAFEIRRTKTSRPHFLNILREFKNRIPSRRPLRHLKIEGFKLRL